MEKNVFGKALKPCCDSQVTGFTRSGYCEVPKSDFGNHSVCAVVTDEFLKYTKDKGNDLSTPNTLYGFPGLKDGDRWCLCAARWQEAYDAGVAPLVVLESTNQKALEICDLDNLKKHEFGGKVES